MENSSNINSSPEDENIDVNINSNSDEEYTPKLFSDEGQTQENNVKDNDDTQSEKLFDQDTNEDEDFEIPAFLRKQKF